MSVLIGTSGLYRLTINYQVGQREDLKNTPTFEMNFLDPIDSDVATGVLDNTVGLLADLLDNDCRIHRAVLSTYQKDSEPYDPFALVTRDYNINGNRVNASEVAPWEFVAHIARIPQSGKVGRLSLRGAFTDSETEETVDGLVIPAVTFTSYQSAVDAFFDGVNTYIDGYGGFLCMAGEPLISTSYVLMPDGQPPKRINTYGPTIIRPIKEFVLKGITIKQKEQ